MLPWPVSAGPIQVLLEEDFQRVTGLSTAATVRTVGNILSNNPDQRNGAPAASAVNTGNGNASLAAFNVRRGDNAIDGGAGAAPPNFGDSNFDNFFGPGSNQFLVIGDDSGNLGGAPNGGSGAASSTMEIKFELATLALANPKGYGVRFDYVFDANNVNNPDDFVAELILDNSSIYTLLNFVAPSVLTRGTLDIFLPFDLLRAAPTHLNFRLVEGSGNGSSAVGLDNIRVTAVPEPGALALIGLGLVGVSLLRRRRA